MPRTYHKKTTLEVVGRAIAQEVSNDQNRNDQEDNQEDLEIQIHVFAKTPADDDH